MIARLEGMLRDLSNHHRSRQDLDFHYVVNRLSTSLHNYYEDLDKDVHYLENREEIKLMKRMSKQL